MGVIAREGGKSAAETGEGAHPGAAEVDRVMNTQTLFIEWVEKGVPSQ